MGQKKLKKVNELPSDDLIKFGNTFFSGAKKAFPNLIELLQIVLTIAVSTASCE